MIQVEGNLSDKQMGSVLKNMRLQLGRKVVEPRVREFMVEEKTKFDSFFSADLIQFSDSNGNNIIRPFVYCSDLLGFVHEVARLRGLHVGDLVYKVGLDGGKGHLKMVLSMYDPDRVLDNLGGGGRVSRDLGIGSGGDYSLLGRKKVMLLAISPDIPENYRNLQTIYDLVGVSKLPFKQTGDLKAINIMLGIMSCSSSCGCCYCQTKRTDKEWISGGGTLRTAGSLSENFEKFKKSGGDRDKAKDISNNCVQKPLIFDENADPTTTVLLQCPPPSLHLKLSLNHLLKELTKVWPPLLTWLASKHIVLEPYHGGRTLEGNDCNKVLRNLDSLGTVIAPNLLVFLETLESFRDVVDSCFGFLLDPYYSRSWPSSEICSVFRRICSPSV